MRCGFCYILDVRSGTFRGFLIAALAGLSAVAACGHSPEARPETKEDSVQAPFHGTVSVDGNPIRGADVLLLDAAGKVVAAAQTDEAGGYRLASPAGFSRGMLLARLYRPIVGARATAVTHPADTGFDFATRDTVSLTGDVEAPAGVTPDFLDVSLTPRALDGVPPSAAMALIVVDTGPALKASYLTEQIKSLHFAFRVLPGTWELLVNRVVEEAPAVKPSTPNLTNAELTLPDGSKPAQTFGAYRLEVRHDLQVRVRLAVMKDSH